MTFTLDSDFEWFLEKFGAPEKTNEATPEVINKYKGLLPDRLLNYWQEYDFCQFRDGLFKIVNPDDYKDTVFTWLKGTGFLEIDTFHAFAMSGFGEIYLWGEKTGQSVNIEVFNGRIFSNGSEEDKIKRKGADDRIRAFFSITGTDTVDLEDVDTDESIFEQAVSKFGELKYDEVFGFEPAPFLGGEQTFKAINKVNFFIYSEILASMGQREIMDLSGLAKKAFGK